MVVRPPSGNVVTLPADALAEALEIALSGIEPGTPGGRGLILYTGAAEWQRHSAVVEAARERFEGIQIQLLTGGPLALFCPAAAHDCGHQPPAGPLHAGRDASGGLERVAGRGACCSAAFVGLHVVGKAAELSVLKHADHRLDTSIEQVFQMAMPGQPVTYEARRVMEQRLAAARASQASGGFLLALQALVQAHRAAPEAVLEAMTFRDGALELKASAPDRRVTGSAEPPTAPAGMAGAPGRGHSEGLLVRGQHPDVPGKLTWRRRSTLPPDSQSLSPRDRKCFSWARSSPRFSS